MASISIVLDEKTTDSIGRCSIRIIIRHNGSMSSVSPHIFCARDKFNPLDCNRVIMLSDVKSKQDNSVISRLYLKYLAAINELSLQGKLKSLKAKDIVRFADNGELEEQKVVETIYSYAEHMFLPRCRADKTRGGYIYTLATLREFAGADRALVFADITPALLSRFDEYLERKGQKINSRSVHLRNIRAIYNSAIDDGMANQNDYPFRSFKIKNAYKEKVFMKVERLRELSMLDFKDTQPSLRLARDLFMLSFYLCGINPIDLFYLEKPNVDGVVSFVRHKTAHAETVPIHITIPVEAEPLIERYKGGKQFLFNFSEHYVNYENFYHTLSKRIGEVGAQVGCPELTFYWARYSWATYADRLGVQEKVISKSLGHSDVSLAGQRYISYDWSRTDEANRKVIDYFKGI